MKKYLIALSIILVTTAHAQVPVQQKKINLLLSVEDTQLVLDALQAKPYSQVAGLIQNIINQAQKQLADSSKPKK